jgi:hypothetical protein
MVVSFSVQYLVATKDKDDWLGVRERLRKTSNNILPCFNYRRMHFRIRIICTLRSTLHSDNVVGLVDKNMMSWTDDPPRRKYSVNLGKFTRRAPREHANFSKIHWVGGRVCVCVEGGGSSVQEIIFLSTRPTTLSE